MHHYNFNCIIKKFNCVIRIVHIFGENHAMICIGLNLSIALIVEDPAEDTPIPALHDIYMYILILH